MKRIELHGGLGDVYLCIHKTSAYEALSKLKAGDHVDVYINSHNPCVRELFDWHPMRKQLAIYVASRFFPEHVNEKIRTDFGFPPKIYHGPWVPRGGTPLVYYPSPEDIKVLEEQLPKKPFLLCALSASGRDRSIPQDISEKCVEFCRKNDIPVVLTGRRYGAIFHPALRIQHLEVSVAQPGVVDLIDKLSVAGTSVAVQRCAAMLSCHSSLNLLGWFEKKPQFLCYPKSAFDRHFNNRQDIWSFGKNFDTTDHMLFEDFTLERFEKFIRRMFKL